MHLQIVKFYSAIDFSIAENAMESDSIKFIPHFHVGKTEISPAQLRSPTGITSHLNCNSDLQAV